MAGKYPRANNYLKYRKIDSDTCKVEDIRTGETWEMGMDLVRFLRKLDGRSDPYKVVRGMDKDFIDSILSWLYYEDLIRTEGRIIPMGIGSVLVTLYIPKVRRIHRSLAKLFNLLLLTLCIPILVCAVYICINHLYILVEDDFSMIEGEILALVFGLVLHELAHACACLAYGGRVIEFGVMLHYFIPGAYVSIDYDNVKNRFKRAQINAAGVEMDLLLCGIFLCLSCLGRFNGRMLFYAALINFMLAAINVSLAEGVDGMSILSELLGVDNIVKNARNVVKSRRKKKKLREKGINGCVVITACYAIVLFQILIPLIVAVGAVNIVSIFLG